MQLVGLVGRRAVGVAVVGFLVGVSCTSSNVDEVKLAPTQELRVRLAKEPSTFDPGLQQWSYEAAVGRQTFEALLRPTRDFKDVAGAAADSYKIDSSGKVYTFKLHPGARWSDGQPVRAADFVYAFQRLLDPRVGAPFASFYFTVKNGAYVNGLDAQDPGVEAALKTLGLKAIDDSTFEVTLEAPAGYFKWIAGLWTSAPVRQDVVKQFGVDSSGGERWGAVGSLAPQQVVGNGVFKIAEVVSKDHVTLVRNPNYSGSATRPALNKITEYFIEDEAVAYSKYRNGELDMVAVPVAMSDAVRSSPELVVIPQLSVFWINLNVRTAPFDNPKVRLAFAQAIDRESYSTGVRGGRVVAASALVPKGMRNYRPDLGAPQKFDPAAARATLAASGASAGSLNGMKFLYPGSSVVGKATAEFVQAQLKTNLGVDVVLDRADSRTFGNRLRAGNYTFGGPSGWGGDYPDAQEWFGIFMTGSASQFSGWSNASYDEAVTAADANSDQAKRDAGYESAQKVLVSEAPVVFMYQATAWYVVKPYVRGMVPSAGDDEWPGGFFPWTIRIALH